MDDAVPPTSLADRGGLTAALEALLFAAGEPVTATELAEALFGVEVGAVRAGLAELAERLEGSGLQLLAVGGGWQLRTRPQYADAILRLRGGRPTKMSKAALEVLAVVAYRQPVTRSEIDEIRGVASGGPVKLLLDKGYLKIAGRRQEPGRPLEYATTSAFLEVFSLPGLGALPTLKERQELVDEPTAPPVELVVLEAGAAARITTPDELDGAEAPDTAVEDEDLPPEPGEP